MRRLIALSIAFLSTSVLAHEVQVLGQHIKLNRQKESAWQSDVLAKAVVSSKWEVGLQATYLDRFNLNERRAGVFAFLKPNTNLTFEMRYLKGDSDSEILARNQYSFILYHALTQGISPHLFYQNSLYSITHLQTLRFGIEIEKIANLIIIPQVMLGQAQFKDPTEVREVNSYGLKIIYYKEQQHAFSVFSYKGTEASQAIIGRSSQTIATQTIGGSVSYYFIPDVKTEFIFDYTDLGKLDNQFLTSTLNLTWVF